MALGLCPAARRISATRYASSRLFRYQRGLERQFHVDGRNRVSNVWAPTRLPDRKGTKPKIQEDAHEYLINAGFLRRAYSGVFHMLPLGLRVQEKIERLIDKHMRSLGASKLSLSSLSSQELWTQSGRLKENSDIFRFKDRKGSKFILSPTHEEEITYLVKGITRSYKHLPIRVYQISRKYRDEPRPRQGMLRGREFVMKDLYTFDHSAEGAMKTYQMVRSAYTALFKELKVPFLVAQASSGDMGGSLSHEFHFPTPKGEDTLVSCSKCDQVYNEELATGKAGEDDAPNLTHNTGFATDETQVGTAPAISNGLWMGISRDKKTLIRCWYPKYVIDEASQQPVDREPNSHAIQAVASLAGFDIDARIEHPLQQWAAQMKSDKTSDLTPRTHQVLDLYDCRVRAFQRPPLSDILESAGCSAEDIQYSMMDRFPATASGLNLVKANGEKCPKCTEGVLSSHTATELGHTFHLGTRYTEPFKAAVTIPEVLEETGPSSNRSKLSLIEMGCHGIGVSRLIAAVADILADNKGLNWPRAIAPYEVIVLPMPIHCPESDAEMVYDALASDKGNMDVVLDDRDKQPAYKLGDADLIGYPVLVVLGRAWNERQMAEVQCRQRRVRREVPLGELPRFVRSLLEKL